MESSATKLLENGILGALVLILLYALKYIFGLLLAEKDKRINDAKETVTHVTVALDKNNETIKALLVAVEGLQKQHEPEKTPQEIRSQ